jgi:capsular polysaccharide biosynthesis protein
VLEVRDGRLVGEFGATVTPGGILDYQTSGYFGLSSWREHPLYLHPTVGRVEHVPGTVVSLTTRGTAVNYYHFLYDSLARLGILQDALPDEPLTTVVVPHRAGYQRALLELAGITCRLIEPAPGVTVQADRLLVPSTPNQDLDAPLSAVTWLRARLRPSGRTDTPRRLYITRGDKPNTRRYVHEQQLWPWLETQGFTRIDPGAHPVQEQIDLFHGAEVVIAPHGAGLTNITFCRPGTHVLELFTPDYVHLGLWTIASAVGLDYRYLVGDGAQVPRRAMTGVLTDVDVPVDLIKDFVATMLS